MARDSVTDSISIGRIERRVLLLGLPIVLGMPLKALAQKPTLKARDLNHVALVVSNLERSLEFYQDLFGLPIQARQGDARLLRVGGGPQFISLRPGNGAAPAISHIGLGIDDFDVPRTLSVLATHGISLAEPGAAGLSGGPMKARIRNRGSVSGGSGGGTPELFIGDPDGIVTQLQSNGYCGGSGAAGDVCASVEPLRSQGAIVLQEINHVTVRVPNAVRSNTFYRDLFGFPIRSFQGPTAPTLAIGRVGFLMFSGRRGGATATIDHVCFNVPSFNVDGLVKSLESFGLKARGTGAPGPMQWYVSMRMEDRGGAKEGTPELYLTDPDGIPIQLQDLSYCGGGGYLGNACP